MADKLSTPALDGSALNARVVQLTGLTESNAESYDLRYGTSSNLSSVTASTITPNANGVYEVESLNAATTYYFQVRAVGDGTDYLTSEWSNTKAIKTGNLWPEIVVQNLNDSGAGSLRQALNDIATNGTITFGDSLSGGTIYLQSILAAARACTIDGSDLREKITLDGGRTYAGDVIENNGHGLFSGSTASAQFKSVKFKNGYGAQIILNATLIDCEISNCVISDNSTNRGVCMTCTLHRCKLYDNTSYTTHSNSAATGSTAYNCLFYGNSGVDFSNTGQAYNCTFSGNIGGATNVSAEKFFNCLYGNFFNAPSSVLSSTSKKVTNAADYFVDPENDDYHLKAGSPAIGAGSNSYVEQPASATDLDGNARIQGTNVDCGCYEYAPVTLTAPTLTLTSLTQTSATINLPTLPTGAVKYVLEYDTASDFETATSVDVTGTTFAGTGLSGTIYFRAKAIGNNESTVTSGWGSTVSRYFGTVAPTIIGVDTTSALSIVVGSTSSLTTGVSVSDDIDTALQVYYYVVDEDGEYVYDEDDNYQNIDADQIPVGTYTIQYYAIDSAGNESSIVSRTLNVVPPTLGKPTIVAIATGSQRIVLYGLDNSNASSWKVRYATTSAGLTSATENTLTLDQTSAFITSLTAGTTYYIQVKAVGDGLNYATSEWSTAVSATTLSSSLNGSMDLFRIKQNIYPSDMVVRYTQLGFLARILAIDSDTVLNPNLVTSAVFNLYKDETAVTGFSGLTVPNDCFKSSLQTNANLWTADSTGYNFCYIPDQRLKWAMSETGVYRAEFIFQIDGRNPIRFVYVINVIG